MLDSIYFMLGRLGLSHFYACGDVTYVKLTREFHNSLTYSVKPDTASTIGTVKFRMFNREFKYSTDRLVDLLNIPYGEGVIYETPLDTDEVNNFGEFWEQLTRHNATSFDGNVASSIHNSAICYFQKMLADTIFD